MNQKTITGSTDSNGLFTAKNPYERMYSATEHMHHNEFAENHPPLFCYNENNELVKGVEGLEVVGPCYQGRVLHEQDWELISKDEFDNFAFNKFLEVRRVYTTPLPEAQPLEGVKFTHPFRVGRKQNRAVLDANGVEVVVFKDGLQDMAMNYCNMLNAQFATDAGGGNKQLLTDCQEMLMNLIALNHVPDEVCPVMNDMISRIDDALTAPSTHSIREMVEVEKVIDCISNFFSVTDVENTDCGALINSIKNINHAL